MSNTIYCTYLTIYSGNKLPVFYIGYSTEKKINKGYHGSASSKQYGNIWKSELIDNPKLFKTIILTKHISKEDAIEKERYFQKNLNVLKNPLYINRSITSSKSFYTNYHNGMKGKTHTDEWKRNQSIIAKRINAIPEIKQKISDSKKGDKNPMYGIPPSNKGKKWFNDGTKNFYLNPNDPSTKLYKPGLFPNNKRKGRIPWNKKI